MPVECGFHDERGGSELLIEPGRCCKSSSVFPFLLPPIHRFHVRHRSTYRHIDDTVAKVLNLPVVNQRMISGSNGTHEVNVYLAQIYVPSLEETILGQFAGVKLVESGSKHGAILGRTFLQKIRMNYNGLTGQVTLTKP